jgi:hypothetical protein
MIVAHAIYGDDADQYLQGIYRTDEDNRVAAEEQFMTLRPLRKGDLSFWEALASIDAHKIRIELHASILYDALQHSQLLLENAATSLDELRLYLDALQTVSGRASNRSKPLCTRSPQTFPDGSGHAALFTNLGPDRSVAC